MDPEYGPNMLTAAVAADLQKLSFAGRSEMA